MISVYNEHYEIDDSFARLDFARVEKWLSKEYWCPGIGRDEIELAATHSSITVGCYFDGIQVGYLRALSDRTRFAYFMDIYVDEAHRRRGIANAMIRFVFNHPDHKNVFMWLLATKDAHGVYEKAGFKPLPKPGMWMLLREEDKWNARFGAFPNPAKDFREDR
ncbi:MAG: GNAT family N-acetyltransferase [Nitrospinae bacterium]|nr:GNAT family N-acetyltransferase [Nitrospinota bacterium]